MGQYENALNEILQLLIVGYAEHIEGGEKSKEMHRTWHDVNEYCFAIEYRHAVEVRWFDGAREWEGTVGESAIASAKNKNQKEIRDYFGHSVDRMNPPEAW